MSARTRCASAAATGLPSSRSNSAKADSAVAGVAIEDSEAREQQRQEKTRRTLDPIETKIDRRRHRTCLAQRELHSREVDDRGEAEIAVQRDEAARLGDERSRAREISAHGTDDGDPPGAPHDSPRHGCQARRRERAFRARGGIHDVPLQERDAGTVDDRGRLHHAR